MKNILGVIVLILSIFSYNSKAGPFDTGMTTLKQPNNVTFIGRMWGDEFIYWAETEDGYTFIQSTDGWYYYATLNEQGEYSPTIYKVGINSPPASSYHLERSEARMEEIFQRIQEFTESVKGAGEWFEQKQIEAQNQPVTLKVGMILIEFKDVEHFKSTEPPYNRPNGYLKSDFENMMYSENYWVDPEYHPENEEIFGSFRDYWYQISRSKLRIEGRVVNPADQNGVPVWLTSDTNRVEYINNLDYKTLATEAKNKALDSGWISLTPGDTNYYDKLAIVFAQRTFGTTHLITYADPDSHYIQVSEQCSKELVQNEDYTFTHMGVYAHEFGHNLGFNDEYRQENPPLGWAEEDGMTDTYNFDLMSWGIYNGPLRKGECPATLSPYYRIIANWISSIPLTADTNNFVAEYDNENPKVYRISPISAIEDEHFLFESRGRDGFDKYIPWSPNDTTIQSGNLIVWYHNMKYVYEPTGLVQQIEAELLAQITLGTGHRY